MKMDRHELIELIEGLYPADSENETTRKIGQMILIHAIGTDWRDLPVEMLRKYAEQCSYCDGNNIK